MLYDKLTQRESAVVTLKKKGLSDREVATILRISYSTVRSYLDRARLKLGCNNTFELISIVKKKYQTQ